ncbi:hypothetical protein PRZ48_008275 [Zasmidium cellare]|uniref:Uncharacterized protein n=1 Tax=Zasmidium cellare TaxID=395010 RepID=A0ABR0EF03_ZASCE|nr:hypothetical protein PRZ48_008275 [Zasmidium cellare]
MSDSESSSNETALAWRSGRALLKSYGSDLFSRLPKSKAIIIADPQQIEYEKIGAKTQQRPTDPTYRQDIAEKRLQSMMDAPVDFAKQRTKLKEHLPSLDFYGINIDGQTSAPK